MDTASPASPPSSSALLEVTDLRVDFHTRAGRVHAVDGVSFSVAAGETLAVLGESGSGKSVTAQAIMGILDSPPAEIVGGSVLLEGRDLLTLPAAQRRAARGSEIALVFQDSLSALNPVQPVARQIAELYRIHRGMGRSEAWRRAVEMMDRVRIPAAASRAHDYPHQFSGGMRQRIVIAMALALDPKVVIADEPTTALDVTVQAQILDLLAEQQRERDMGLILITHDLGVAAQVATNAVVMYAGRIVERSRVRDLFLDPVHPYSHGLVASIPRDLPRGSALPAIPGMPPSLTARPGGCQFHPRCPLAQPRCRTDEPPLLPVKDGRESACHFWTKVGER
ncbi:ABC transporter ATP-binding protein [Streptoalloteichus tenebrarius]|uniref:ABC transporter ATP-binding protein n=1 Tax=Streptoalloteichus tenebrarius (strain ATCC 17920 / DSM 40477 / JCM 4838 / CBS 697.72 / NBRC 16177 / NCIMB 11028 / NRRL B-12390 / A12253. 1 / ISP 5477) TaxID=1933 RepID=UPI0020A4664E|nr:ABC transporter ATP-binding protein [Streptoalloteichus tenebrarius]